MNTIIVTGGAGFIGSAVVRNLMEEGEVRVVVIDKLTYAADTDSLAPFVSSNRFVLEKQDICDGVAMERIFVEYQPSAVLHLAAETHVDRSIDAPSVFVETNVNGTYTLLEVALGYWKKMDRDIRDRFRFLHVSTDEVFGSLGQEGYFHEESLYRPNSPYSATKAASDHLVRAWHHTYGLPVLTTNCTNNYGPFQFIEKLIPTVIIKALNGEPIPVYGRGENVRDWLHVDDHADALKLVLRRGRVGETYCIGGQAERRNIDLVRTIMKVIDDLLPLASGRSRQELISFVTDRPAHDARYAMNISKISNELGWVPSKSFDAGMRETIQWYLDHQQWWRHILATRYGGERLGATERVLG